ncbi:MAG: hypothetical protein WCH31_09450 [Actinomycetes bacterium]
MSTRAMFLRLTASVGSLAAAGIAVALVVTLVRSAPGPVAATASQAAAPVAPAVPPVPGGRVPTPGSTRFPAPPAGAFVLARQAGTYALGLAIAPYGAQTLVRVSVVGPSGVGAAGLDVRVRFGVAYFMRADPCGPGCYQTAVIGMPGSPVTVSLGSAAYPIDLPAGEPEDGARLLTEATAAWRALPSLAWTERLDGATGKAVVTRYRAHSPDRLAYTAQRGPAAIVIGSRRWERSGPGARWKLAPVAAAPIRQPVPPWTRPVDARVVGHGVIAGHRVVMVSFFDAATPAWFLASIDVASHRTVGITMTAASHFMVSVYDAFGEPVRVVAP